MCLFVIPDIHGHADKLDQAIARIDTFAGKDANVVFLGDYTDRGPESRKVIQTLIDGAATGRNWIFLRGNHDQLFLDFLTGTRQERENARWFSGNLGGRDTLASYGIDAHDPALDWEDALTAVPESHRKFLSDLPHAYETDALVLVHAGILPGVPLDQQDPYDLIWIREPFLSDTRDHGRLIVHGHTPLEHPTHFVNRIGLDGSVAWGGELHVAMFKGRDCYLLTDTGPVPLTTLGG